MRTKVIFSKNQELINKHTCSYYNEGGHEESQCPMLSRKLKVQWCDFKETRCSRSGLPWVCSSKVSLALEFLTGLVPLPLSLTHAMKCQLLTAWKHLSSESKFRAILSFSRLKLLNIPLGPLLEEYSPLLLCDTRLAHLTKMSSADRTGRCHAARKASVRVLAETPTCFSWQPIWVHTQYPCTLLSQEPAGELAKLGPLGHGRG